MPPLPRAMAGGAEIPANIDTDVVVASTDMTLEQTQQMIRNTSPSVVVIERPYDNRTDPLYQATRGADGYDGRAKAAAN